MNSAARIENARKITRKYCEKLGDDVAARAVL
jgi:hypothetical protein